MYNFKNIFSKNKSFFIYSSIFIVFSILLIYAGFILYKSLSSEHINAHLNQLEQATALQSKLTSSFLNERLADAYTIKENRLIGNMVKLIFFSNNYDEKFKKQWLKRFNKFNYYSNIALLSTKGKIIESEGDNIDSISYESRDIFNSALNKREIIFSDFYWCGLCKTFHIDLYVPIFDYSTKNNKIIAVILFRVSSNTFLFPLIKSFVKYGNTAETIILLNDSTYLSLHDSIEYLRVANISKTSKTLFGKIKNDNYYGKFEGSDEFGREVYAYSDSIEGTNWILINKTDKKDTNSSNITTGIRIIIVTILLIFMTLILLLYISILQKNKNIEQSLANEKEKQFLMNNMDYILEFASDVIMLLDKRGYVKYINKAGTDMYEKSLKEIVGMNFYSISEPLNNIGAFDENLSLIIGEDGAIFEAEHKTASGKIIPVEISAKKIYMYNDFYYQFMIRNLTERKDFENELLKNNEKLSVLNSELTKRNEIIGIADAEKENQLRLLRENEIHLNEYTQKYLYMFDNIHSGIVVLRAQDNGEDFIFKSMNKSSEKLENADSKTIIGKSLTSCFPAAREYGIFDVIKRVYMTGESEFLNDKLFTNNGKITWRDNFIYKLPSGEIVVIYNDITEKYTTIKEMRVLSNYAISLINLHDMNEIREASGKAIMNVIEDGFVFISTYDALKREVFLSHSFGLSEIKSVLENILKFDPFKVSISIDKYSKKQLEEFTNKKLNFVEDGIFEIINNKTSRQVCKFIENHFKIKFVYTMGFIVENSLYGGVTLLLKNDLDKRQSEIIQTIVNQASTALNRIYSEDLRFKQKETYNHIFGILPVMIIKYDSANKVTLVNNECGKLTGWSNDDLNAFDFFSLCFTDEKTRNEIFQYMLEMKNEWREFEMTCKSGAMLKTMWKMISTNDGDCWGIGLDISEKKRFESEKKQLEQQLFQIQKMDAIGQLAGGIAHDFNNMLAGILGNAEILKTTVKDSESVKHVDRIIKSAEHSSELTRQLLTFARKGQYRIISCDIHKIIYDVIHMIKPSLDKKIIIEDDFKSKSPFVLCDPAQIENAIMNLSLNARDAMPNGGTLTFITDDVYLDKEYIENHTHNIKDGWYVCIQVRDTGTGMSEEVKKHLYEPFYTTKDIGKGTGLGLASVYGCIKNHNGSLEVYSELNYGSSFKIYLPVSKEKPIKHIDPKSAFVHFENATILIVDDEDMIREILAEVLKKIGFNILQAHDGAEGLNIYKLHQKEISLVILDMIMPVMDGKELLVNLKSLNPAIKAIMSSGYAADREVSKLISSKNIRFIQKPYKTNELLSLLKEII